MASENKIKVVTFVSRTRVEGPGVRYAIWLKNPLDQASHDEWAHTPSPLEYTPEALAHKVIEADVDGITLLGFEPFKQAQSLCDLARLMHNAGRTVVVYTGYGYSHLKSIALEEHGVRMLLSHTDILITGSLAQWSPDQSRRWVGSINQQVHFLSEAYDDNWRRRRPVLQ